MQIYKICKSKIYKTTNLQIQNQIYNEIYNIYKSTKSTRSTKYTNLQNLQSNIQSNIESNLQNVHKLRIVHIIYGGILDLVMDSEPTGSVDWMPTPFSDHFVPYYDVQQDSEMVICNKTGYEVLHNK